MLDPDSHPDGNLRSAEPRAIIGLWAGFKFRLGAEVGQGVESPEFEDADWTPVDLPHTWNAEDGTSKQFQRGVGWYRLRFHAPEAARLRRAYLRFRGVSTVSTVWLNACELGTHWSATSAFCYDASAALRPGAENVLVVRADNRFRDDVPPRAGDFTVFGGIYRHVELILASRLSIDLLDHAGPGVYLRTPEISAERCRVHARVRLRNVGQRERGIVVALSVLDAEGQRIACTRTEHAALPGVSEAVLELGIDKPRLWRARLDPYLYTAVVEVRDRGELLDRVRQPLGFRTFRVDADRGFILNGEVYDLRGANLHQDWGDKGWAITPADREQDFRLLLDMGCSFVRLVHYQHDSHAYELADRLGLIVWAEHGLVNTVSESPLFSARAARQLTELIRQSYNHPSIVAWGIGNEVQTHEPPAAPRLLRLLAALVKTEDPSRMSALATCFDEPAGSYGVELIAHNKYFGWYQGTFAEFPSWLDAQREKNPALPMGMSEYGAGAGTTLHSTAPKALDHSEEHQSLLHEAYWRALCERPWLWCKAVWQMFDSASFYREEGERAGINDKGLVTRDRQTRKDAFFWYKANWTELPLVYITSRRFTPRSESRTEVKVYSNSSEVELRVNGRSSGVRRVEDHVARWLEVELERGENRVQVTGRCGDAEVSDSCVWVLEA